MHILFAAMAERELIICVRRTAGAYCYFECLDVGVDVTVAGSLLNMKRSRIANTHIY